MSLFFAKEEQQQQQEEEGRRGAGSLRKSNVSGASGAGAGAGNGNSTHNNNDSDIAMLSRIEQGAGAGAGVGSGRWPPQEQGSHCRQPKEDQGGNGSKAEDGTAARSERSSRSSSPYTSTRAPGRDRSRVGSGIYVRTDYTVTVEEGGGGNSSNSAGNNGNGMGNRYREGAWRRREEFG